MSAAVDITNFNPLKITSVTVKWQIENIWHLSFQGTSSSVFLLSDHIFHLQARKYDLGIAFYLCRAEAKPIVMNLLCKMSMIDHVGNEKLVGEREVAFEKGKEFVLLQSVMISELEDRKSEFIINDTLTMSCSIASSYRLNIMKQQIPEGEKVLSRFETLSSDMENFYKSHMNTDGLIKADSAEFPVHLTVIQARSPELASMLSETKTLEIHDMSATILGDVLFYIYTGKIKNLSADSVIQMLAAANKFSLLELRDICLKFLHTNLNESNIFEAAVLSHENADLFLREEVEQYLVKNVSTIVHSERWNEFCKDKYKLANEILTNVLLRLKPKENAMEEH